MTIPFESQLEISECRITIKKSTGLAVTKNVSVYSSSKGICAAVCLLLPLFANLTMNPNYKGTIHQLGRKMEVVLEVVFIFL